MKMSIFRHVSLAFYSSVSEHDLRVQANGYLSSAIGALALDQRVPSVITCSGRTGIIQQALVWASNATRLSVGAMLAAICLVAPVPGFAALKCSSLSSIGCKGEAYCTVVGGNSCCPLTDPNNCGTCVLRPVGTCKTCSTTCVLNNDSADAPMPMWANVVLSAVLAATGLYYMRRYRN